MLQRNVSLKPYNTFGIDVSASFFRSITHEKMLSEFLMDNAHDLPPILILGGGSNMLLVSDIEGVILKNDIKGIAVVEEDEQRVLVQIGGGENWHNFVMHCLDHGWGGVENMALIPGSMGAAPIQNIGAYGVELKDVFEKLEAVHLRTGAIQTFDHAACQFGYRDSIFKREAKGQYLISRVYLRLQKAPHTPNIEYAALRKSLEAQDIQNPDIRQVAELVIAIRQSKLPDPAEIGNSGSFFKNPVIASDHLAEIQRNYPNIPHYWQEGRETVKVPAGWLIETCGWKGYRDGDIGVHAKQALVLVNYGNAEGKSIYDLSSRILDDVLAKFDITLEREVNVIGDLGQGHT
ncbi:MAG: UDP-N-acetylmuramate dehydrogenase [Bacteroidia bacterium]